LHVSQGQFPSPPELASACSLDDGPRRSSRSRYRFSACGGSDTASDADLCDSQLVDWQNQVGELTSWTSSMLIGEGIDACDSLSTDAMETGKRLQDQVQDGNLDDALSELLDELGTLGDIAATGPGSPELVVAQGEVLEDQVVVASRCVELLDEAP
jgi:hypothetical protein